MTKRILTFLLMLAVCAGILPLTAIKANAEYNLITDRETVDGSDYTDSSAMAEKLNEIFDGNASIYADKACTIPVDTLLGTSPVKNNGVSMHVGPEGGEYLSRGTSCFIYANGVYYTLFGESTGGGEAGENSEKLDLSITGSRSATYENFKAWGVRQGVGALIRGSGHSMILLDYDENTITILDGNSDGKGRVSICTRSWEKFSEYYYIQYIIQPTDSHYSALYASGMCGDDLYWFVDEAGTLTITGSGNIQYPGWTEYSDSIQKVVIDEGITGIRDGMFHGCRNAREIVFNGAAPVFSEIAFLGISATIHYPATARGWSEEVRKLYGGNLTWQPYGMTELRITAQPAVTVSEDRTTATVTVEAEGDGLTYTWYSKDAADAMFVKSSVTGSAYCTQVSSRQVMCVIQDQYGNFIKSESVLLGGNDASADPPSNLLTAKYPI